MIRKLNLSKPEMDIALTDDGETIPERLFSLVLLSSTLFIQNFSYKFQIFWEGQKIE